MVSTRRPTSAPDYGAEVRSKKTMKTTQERITLAHRTFILEHKKVDIPGAFVDGLLETWTILKPLTPLNLPGFGNCPSMEVICWAPTRKEAIDKAIDKLI